MDHVLTKGHCDLHGEVTLLIIFKGACFEIKKKFFLQIQWCRQQGNRSGGSYHELSLSLNDLLQTDLHEQVGRREDPETDGKEGPALHTALTVLVVHQLLTDLAVNLVPAQRNKHMRENGRKLCEPKSRR